MYNKKAAIGATMTWIVATIIILFVIILFVYGTKLFVTSEEIRRSFWVKGNLVRETILSAESEQMLLALLETKIDGKSVKDHLSEENYKTHLNKIKGELEPIVKTLPGNTKEEGWGLAIFPLDNNKGFYIGQEKYEKIMGLGYVLQSRSDCSLVYLKGAKASLCKLTK